jgi:hypothetical protein
MIHGFATLPRCLNRNSQLIARVRLPGKIG